MSWYRLPALSRAMGAVAIAADGAGAYRGSYWQIVRRYGVRPSAIRSIPSPSRCHGEHADSRVDRR
ncbi:MAG: hypothetical protein R2713_00045 [Ilumatobacteraceae bacterium]